MTDGVWSELKEPDGKLECSIVRRNLQRDHLSRLNRLVIGNSRNPLADLYGYVVFSGTSNYPADARSLARAHLVEINDRIKAALAQEGLEIEESTRAHLEESTDLITKVLNAQVESNRQ